MIGKFLGKIANPAVCDRTSAIIDDSDFVSVFLV